MNMKLDLRVNTRSINRFFQKNEQIMSVVWAKKMQIKMNQTILTTPLDVGRLKNPQFYDFFGTTKVLATYGARTFDLLHIVYGFDV